MDIQPKHPPDEQSRGKQRNKPKRGFGGKGSRKRIWIRWSCVVVLAGLVCQFAVSFDHRLLDFSIGLLFLTFVGAAHALWVDLANHHERHKAAFIQSAVVVLAGLVFCGWLYWLKLHPERSIEPYIEGTSFTRSQIAEMFPFGYTIFAKAEGEYQFRPKPDGHLVTYVNLEKVKVEPNFAQGVVVWELNQLGFQFEGVHGNNLTARFAFPMDEGVVRYPPRVFFVQNQPSLCVSTLSTNQRSPVFVMGFRIEPANPPAKQPALRRGK